MKKKRQEQIIEIIQNHEVETQEDLAGYLTEAGYAVTQATVSRDIRELSLEKVPGQKVRQKYAMRSTIPVAAEIKHPAAQPANRYAALLQDGIVSMEQAGNLLVIKTAVGKSMRRSMRRCSLTSLKLSVMVEISSVTLTSTYRGV